jgi:RNA polymerase sigma-70 factor (ECF subfamily)
MDQTLPRTSAPVVLDTMLQQPIVRQPDSLDELFARVVASDYHAFDKIFKSTYKTLCLAANRIVKSHELAEEIVDDVFYNLWKNREKIQISVSFKSYLMASIRNKSLDCLRKMKNEKNTALENASAVPCKNSIAYESMNYEDLFRQIEAAIQKLPRQCKLIFLMSRDQDLKYKEIAEALNLSIKTVDTQMGRALKYLRKSIPPAYL